MQKEPAAAKRPFSTLRKPNNFSKPQLVVFVVAFAVIGYLVFRSFAAAPLVASVEGENMVAPNSGGSTSASTTTQESETMTLPAGASVVTDTAASGGKAIELTQNGTATGTVSFPSSVSSFTVTARGDQCSGAPAMTVAIDGANVLSNTAVSSTTWAAYNATPTAGIASGSHSLTISFTNDYYSTGKAHGKNGKVSGTCDRNLYADKIVFNSPGTTQSPISSVVTDSSASNGQELNLYSAGTVTSSFNLPSSAASFTVVAKASVCNGVGAAMNVSVDGSQLLSTTVNSTSLTSYSANSTLNSGTHTLAISFTNDYYVAGTCDRNLYLDVTNFYGPVTVTPPPTVTLSASPTSVTAGQSSTLTWNSANATSCTASGAWSGSQATSGSASTGALNQNSTYTLTCAGDGGSASASATITVSTSNGGLGYDSFSPVNHSATYLIAMGDSAVPTYQNLSKYDFLHTTGSILSAGNANITAVAKQPGVSVSYMNSWALTTAYTDPVPVSQAQTNGWLAKDSTGNYIGTYGQSGSVQPMTLPGNTGYQQQALANAKQTASMYPGMKGFFIDNILPDYTSEITGSNMYGHYIATAYPDKSTWRSAILSFVKNVGGGLRQSGYFVICNMTGYTNDAGFDDGTFEQSWLTQMAQTGGCDGILLESWMQSPSNFTSLRNNGNSVYPGYFSGFADLVSVANQQKVHFFGGMIGSSTNTQAMRYNKAAFMLKWDGIHGGASYAIAPAYIGGDPWNSAWTQDIGTPTAAAVTVNPAGVWTRTFTGGWIAVNATTASQTVTMNGASYSIGPTDAIIHQGL